MEGEPIESLPLLSVVDMPMVLEDLTIPPAEISSLRVITSSKSFYPLH
jgi:hypothetical protein